MRRGARSRQCANCREPIWWSGTQWLHVAGDGTKWCSEETDEQAVPA